MKASQRIVGGVILGLGFVVALAATAAAQDVKVDWDKAADFTKYKSFSAAVATTWGSPFGEKRALDEVEKTLVAKGWKKADAASADAIVVINGATEGKKSLNTFYSGGGYGGYRYGGMGMGTSTTTVNEFTVGTMVVDIFDAKTKALIWRGIGVDELSDKADKNQKKIVNATKDMFKKFPPTPGTK
jgi:Domain of unknown function (DUF4136)